MKQTKEYKGTKEEKFAKAEKDCKVFWGDELYDKMVNEILPHVLVWKYGLYYMEFVGIQGYAAQVMLWKYSNAEDKPKEY